MINSINETFEKSGLLDKIIIYFKLEDKIHLIIENYSFPEQKILSILKNSIDSIMEGILLDKFDSLKSNGIISEGSLSDKLEKFKELLEIEDAISKLFYDYPILEEQLSITLNNVIAEIVDILNDFQEDKNEIQNFFKIKANSILDIELDCGDKHNNKSVAKVLIDNTELYYKPKNLNTDHLYRDVLKLLDKYSNFDFKTPSTLSRRTHSWQESIQISQELSLYEAKKYYERAGYMLAACEVLHSTDIHFENIIVSGEYPVIIDTETISSPTNHDNLVNDNFKSIDQSVVATAMLPSRDKLYDVNVSGLFYRPSSSNTLTTNIIIEDAESDYRETKVPVQTSITPNVVLIEGEPLNYRLVIDKLIKGFKDGLSIIKNHKNELLDIVEKYYNKATMIRIILRGTQVYYTFLRELQKPDALKNRSNHEKILNILLSSFTPSSFGYLRVEEEIKDLRNQNIPYFYTYLDSTNLYFEDKVLCENYFKHSAKDNIRHTLGMLDSEMIDYQVHLLKLSIATEFANEDNMNSDFTCNNTDIDINKEFTDSYPFKLLKREIFSNTSESDTFYILNFDERNLVVDLIGPGLYMGGGIIHYLYEYAYYHNSKEIQEFSRRLILKLYNNYKVDKISGVASKAWSVYQGNGGLLYLMYNYSKLFNDEIIEKGFSNLLQNLISDLSTIQFSEQDSDYINGLGATIHLLADLLLKLHSPDDKGSAYTESKNIVLRYWEYLKNNSRFEIGLAHGLSGIVTPLVKNYSLTRKNEILKEIINLVLLEDKKIEENFKEVDFSWCRGIGGVIISRIIIINELSKISNLDRELKIVKKSLSKLLNEELFKKIYSQKGLCLCHGASGTVEILKFLEKNQNINLSKIYRKLLPNIYEIDQYEWFEGVDYQFESFMLGLSGVKYVSLQKEYKTPSVLALETY